MSIGGMFSGELGLRGKGLGQLVSLMIRAFVFEMQK
jgi:hypothetical protein